MGLELARQVEEQGAVLLKNERSQLPLKASKIKSIAIIGSHADVGVLSGGGSAQVDPAGGNAVPPPPPPRGQRRGGFGFGGAVYHHSSPLKAIQAKAPQAKVTYTEGTDLPFTMDLAKKSDVALVFVHQPASEGRDLESLSLPDNQDAIVSAVAKANPHTIVVLENGGPVSMPWINDVKAVLEAWYPGISGAEALANLLFGDANPTAKLPITFPRIDADVPHPKIAGPPPMPPIVTDSNSPPPPGGFRFNNQPFDVNYTEGLKVGYKWYDAEGKQPLFPLGYGLSYTTYAYSNLQVTPGSPVRVSFAVKNTGKRAGTEIAQVYAGLPKATGEPPRRLVAWDKVDLAPSETKTVTLTLDPQFLSVFNADRHRWELLPGDYTLFVGGSSRDTPLQTTIHLG
jgi:beta-glucosidase